MALGMDLASSRVPSSAFICTTREILELAACCVGSVRERAGSSGPAPAQRKCTYPAVVIGIMSRKMSPVCASKTLTPSLATEGHSPVTRGNRLNFQETCINENKILPPPRPD